MQPLMPIAFLTLPSSSHMRKITTVLLLAISALTPAIPATAQSWNWATLGLTNRHATATAVAVDAAGNTYVGGTFRDTLQCGATRLVSAGASDIFLGQLSPAGQWRWAISGGGPTADTLTALVLSPDGYAVIAGTMGDGAHLDTAAFNLNGAATSLFVARIGSPGAGAPGVLSWLRAPNSTNHAGQPTATTGGKLAQDAAGNLYVTGIRDGYQTLDFGSLVLAADTPYYRPRPQFVARLSAGGVWQWATRTSGISDPTISLPLMPSPVAVAANGTVAVGGEGWTGSINGGGGIGPFGMLEMFVGATGVPLRSQSIRPANNGYGYSPQVLAADAAGRLFVGGWQYGNPVNKLWVRALDAATGDSLWHQTMIPGTHVNLALNALAVSPAGGLNLVGGIQTLLCVCDIGPIPPGLYGAFFSDSTELATDGNGFVAQLDGPTGQPRWSLATPASLLGVSTSAGQLHVAGQFDWSAFFAAPTFGPTTLAHDSALGARDALVAELNEAGPLPRAFTVAISATGASLTLIGQNLTIATQVLVGGAPAPFAVVNGALVIAVPPGASGTITVITPQGTATNLSYQPAAPLGTAGVSPAARLQLWPNPVTEAGTVRVTLPGGVSASVEVLDLLGRSLLTLPAARGTLTLPLAGLPAGTYVVRAGTATARLVVE